MVDERWNSPLSHRTALMINSELVIRETPWLGMICLRGDHGILSGVVEKTMGVKLPDTAGSITDAPPISIIWIAPDEWLLISYSTDGEKLIDQLNAALSGMHHQLTDVSDYYTAIDVSGLLARRVLEKLVIVDLHPNSLKPGTVLGTMFARYQVWLQLVDETEPEGPLFRLHVRRSLADHTWCLLARAAREFGIEEQTPVGRVRLHVPEMRA